LVESQRTGVVLCRCRGKASDAMLDSVSAFLQEKRPGIPVTVADNLCEQRILPDIVQRYGVRSVVVGACSDLDVGLHFWEGPDQAAVDHCSVRVVDMLAETECWPSLESAEERLKIMLWAQVRRQDWAVAVPESSLKARFIKPRGSISRRRLLDAVLPRYQVIPYVWSGGCVGLDRCGLCREACPDRAIQAQGNAPFIDLATCRGCGACVVACPHGAISNPCFTQDQLGSELEALLSTGGDSLRPRVIVIGCQGCMPSPRRDVGPGVFSLEVPCLAMISPWLLLRSFDLGAQGLALVSDQANCPLGIESCPSEQYIPFARELLKVWDIEPDRIQCHDGAGADEFLGGFAERVASLPPTPLQMSEPCAVPAKGRRLSSLVAGMTGKLAPGSTGTVCVPGVPFGDVTVESNACTACGLCELHCPSGALRFTSTGGSVRFHFEHRLCLGCGRCVEACPEKCIEMEKVLKLDALEGAPRLLLGGEMAVCRQCGTPFAPKAMIDRLRDRLEAAGISTSQLDICPECRAGVVRRQRRQSVGA